MIPRYEHFFVGIKNACSQRTTSSCLVTINLCTYKLLNSIVNCDLDYDYIAELVSIKYRQIYEEAQKILKDMNFSTLFLARLKVSEKDQNHMPASSKYCSRSQLGWSELPDCLLNCVILQWQSADGSKTISDWKRGHFNFRDEENIFDLLMGIFLFCKKIANASQFSVHVSRRWFARK